MPELNSEEREGVLNATAVVRAYLNRDAEGYEVLASDLRPHDLEALIAMTAMLLRHVAGDHARAFLDVASAEIVEQMSANE